MGALMTPMSTRTLRHEGPYPLALRLLLLSLCSLVAACGDTTLVPRTQVLVQIEASPSIKARARALRVSLASGKGAPSSYEEAPEQLFALDASFSWPASLALLPKGGDAARGFRISVDALDSERVFVSSRVISTFLPQQTLLLEIVLQDACIDFMSCSDELTCRASDGLPACVDAKVDPRGLEVLDDKSPGRFRPDGGARDAGLDAEPHDADQPDPNDGDAAIDAGEPEQDTGPCVASAEDCFNERDDDCDLLPDCMDPDCSAGAVCTLDAPELTLKVPVGTSCPPGYGRAPRLVHRDLGIGGCSGCSCATISATSCVASLTGYSGPADCMGGLTAVRTVNVTLDQCTVTSPLPGSYTAIGVNSIVATPGSCPAIGSPTLGALSWGGESNLCYLERKGGGCAEGHVCVPRHDAGTLCSEGSASCSGSETREVWYSGVADTRACGACVCTSSGGSCALVNAGIADGVDCGQNSASLTTHEDNNRACGPFTSPLVSRGGRPQDGTCTPSAPLTGAATPTGATDLCCRP